MPRKIRTPLFSTLSPSSARRLHGLFVKTGRRQLLRTDEVETTAMASVQWPPPAHPRRGECARMVDTPKRETRKGIDVLHPCYLIVRKVGIAVAPLLLAAASIVVASHQRLYDRQLAVAGRTALNA